jgi:hypothetical protein
MGFPSLCERLFACGKGHTAAGKEMYRYPPPIDNAGYLWRGELAGSWHNFS